MLKASSTYESYDGPPIEAIEFSLHDGNLAGERRKDIARVLRPMVKSLSAHVPSILPVERMAEEVAFDDEGLIDFFVVHVTRSARQADWLGAWKDYAACGRVIHFENHNEQWHPTNAGMIHAEEFLPLVDAGHKLCLDTGHILYASSFQPGSMAWVCSESQWLETAQAAFEKFIELPIGSVHAHSVHHLTGPDHQLDGFDIGPWIKRIVQKNPDVVLLVEVMDPKWSQEDKLSSLETWLA